MEQLYLCGGHDEPVFMSEKGSAEKVEIWV